MKWSDLLMVSEGQLEVHRCQVVAALAENGKQMRQVHATWQMES